MEDRDLKLLKKYDVKVVNNVVSNMFLGSGIAPVSKMVDLGITVGLGTDDANCNNSTNMLVDMKFAALAQKARQLDAAALSAEKVLEMATIDGAKTLGLENEIGSLEPGKRADLIILDMEAPHLKPCHHIPSTIVYQARGTEVEAVMIDGKWLMQNRRPLFLTDFEQEKKVLADAQRVSLAVLKRAGMEHLKNRGWVAG
jgi:cytosine/adenosine deaminase-related metal-dependent hydrolase